jgi:hypothetical protein
MATVSCMNMKAGDTLVCSDCGMELKVTKECKECAEGTTCCTEPSVFQCCGKDLEYVKA